MKGKQKAKKQKTHILQELICVLKLYQYASLCLKNFVTMVTETS